MNSDLSWYSLFLSQNPKRYWFRILVVVGIILFVTILLRKKSYEGFDNGFDQDEPFVLKRGPEVYDKFYAEIYDTIWMSPTLGQKIALTARISKITPASNVLELMCGTGQVVERLAARGIQVQGLDPSSAMIGVGLQRAAFLKIKTGNVEETRIVDLGIFTHVLLLGQGYSRLGGEGLNIFRNVFQWLKPGGKFVLELPSSGENENKDGVAASTAPYRNYQYKRKYENNSLLETFQDLETRKVRQNEHTNLPTSKQCETDCSLAGLVMEAHVSTGDGKSELYLFGKPGP